MRVDFMTVELIAVTDQTRHILRNLFTVYFSELSQWDELVDLNEHGLPVWTAFGVPQPRTHDECADYNWWVRDDCKQYLIQVEGQPAGFVIINAGPADLPKDVEYDLLDFFIAHKYRRRGVGRQAAHGAFDLFHGRWEVAQLTGNAAAVAFWNGVIREYTGGQYERSDEGARQRFQN
jgi:predicted acetyltransferase